MVQPSLAEVLLKFNHGTVSHFNRNGRAVNYFIQGVAERKLRLADAPSNDLITIRKDAVDSCPLFLASDIIVSNVRGQRLDAHLSQGWDDVIRSLSNNISPWVLYPKGMDGSQEVER